MAGGGVYSSGPAVRYNGRVTIAVVLACIVGACTGLLFGYDLGIAGGVSTFPQFQQLFFPHVLDDLSAPFAANGPYCKYNDLRLSLFVSCLFLAGIVGAIIGSHTSKRYGRRATMISAGILFSAGAALMAAAVVLPMLYVGRVLMGLGIGLSCQTGPMFLAEIAPSHLRGSFSIMFQLFITLGILVAQCINYGTHFIHPWGWRLALGLAVVPSALLTLGSLVVPETPNWLVEQGRLAEARRVLTSIRGTTEVDDELKALMVGAEHAHACSSNQWRVLISRSYRPQLVTAIAMGAFNQLDGVNVINFYTPQLFETLGKSQDAALMIHVIIGAVQVVCTIAAVLTVDTVGRKFWMIESSVQMMVTQVIVGAVIATQMQPNGTMSDAAVAGLIAVMAVFIAGHAWGWGPMSWLVLVETQPLEVRAAGTAVGTCVNFALCFVIAQVFLPMLCALRYGVFFFFAGWLLFIGIYALLLIPETKGAHIDEVSGLFANSWFWGTPTRADVELAKAEVEETKGNRC